ncbi:hypothetical protein RB195_018050 [Necator americanus]|uniref:BTB domain-containing protein n=1 Tax=Necator americanus TaxID=51031 RepID=A0ABR1C7Y8_NECAM
MIGLTLNVEGSSEAGLLSEINLRVRRYNQAVKIMDLSAVEGLEIIDFTKKEKVGSHPYEIRLTNGKKVLVHEENAYGNFYEGGRSFEDFEGNKETTLFEFQFDFQVHRDGLKEMKVVGDTIHSNPMAVYHVNVLWCYSYGLSVVQEDDSDLLCQFEMISIGPSFSKKPKTIRGGAGNNCPPNQRAPHIKYITLTIKGKDETQVPLVQIGDRYVADSLLSLSLLNAVMKEMSTLTMRVRLTIPRSYFTLDTLVNLNLKQPNASPAAEKVLATILAGEKPPAFDWVITVGEGSPREYFVHRKVLADASPTLEVIFNTHTSLPTEQLLMVSHEDRFILTSTHASDMKTILTYFYLRQFLLPSFDTFARVGRTLCCLFSSDTVSKFFEHWQVAIVNDLLKLNKKEFETTLLSSARHLISIFSAPYGALPVAKRVAVATMADTWQMAEAAGINVEEVFSNADNLPAGMMEKILFSVGKFRTVVSGVRKTGL